MTGGRVLLGIVLAGLLGAAVPALLAPTAQLRGSDELVYARFGEIPFVGAGAVIEQSVSLQQPDVSLLSIPFHLGGGAPARLRITVSRPDGGVLVKEERRLVPTGNGLGPDLQLLQSFWDSRQAAWLRIAVHDPAQTEVEVLLERLDGGGGDFYFFSDPARATGRSPFKRSDDSALVVQTSYGAIGPAVQKAPLYAGRVNSLAPPWLGGPVPELLFVLLVLLGALLVAVAAWSREPAEEPAAAP